MSSIRSLGNHIQLDTVGETEVYRLPDDYWIVWDEDGEDLPRCKVYLLRRHSASRRQLGDILGGYFQALTFDAGPVKGGFELPRGPWRRLARIQEIRYRRPSVGPKFHPFTRPVTVMYCDDPEAWRLDLPAGCVVNYRGFVNP